MIGDYERRPIFHQFVDLQCSPSQDKQPLDLKGYFYQWLGSEGKNHISLLGDFGTGKTEFCRRMQWELLKKYPTSNANRIPVVITLRINQGGVIPIIFASSVLLFPATIAQFIPNETVQKVVAWFSPSGGLYMIFYFALTFWQPCLATEPRHVTIAFPAVELPSVNDLIPLHLQELHCELLVADVTSRLRQ